MPLPDPEPPKKEKSFWEKVTSTKDKYDAPAQPEKAPAKPTGIAGAAAALKGRGAQIEKALNDAEGAPANKGADKGELGKKWNDTFKF